MSILPLTEHRAVKAMNSRHSNPGSVANEISHWWHQECIQWES